ncbi:MAG: heme exporter protein CcmB [Pseudomonadales bacterium]|jgi:ABC-2 type transport system permease protein|nr:heme exporter protein CcmB [Pseudomonadales bacterium]MCP5332086.1 heme exporter protein CcmB [Pseudomonadales bacterium]HMU90827.1 ABC transporter permease [Pseudomonadales bacterium]HMW15657.1 ABC transporter permease [Pseudomonadales bacterium]HMW83788.1 ABC transporter permease [Pseudomonadales bacterium]
MSATTIVMRRELASYFATPLAYIFIVIFLVVASVFAFSVGNLYEMGQADLLNFFNFHPWLYLFLIPALAMRLWAEERKTGSIELLLTLPIRLHEAVLGKFLAAWLFSGLALLLTFPIWITVNYLGDPDNGIILASYLGSWLMAGAFLAIGSCMSACTSNQVIAFILTIVICFCYVVAGLPLLLNFFEGWASQPLLDAVASLSFMTHFNAISRGVLDFRDLLFFVLMIVGWLTATAIVIDMKKAQ